MFGFLMLNSGLSFLFLIVGVRVWRLESESFSLFVFALVWDGVSDVLLGVDGAGDPTGEAPTRLCSSLSERYGGCPRCYRKSCGHLQNPRKDLQGSLPDEPGLFTKWIR